MGNLLYFSDKIRPLGQKIKFTAIVFCRAIVVLFSWRKAIVCKELSYLQKSQFQNSLLVVNYRFRNALWYKFKHLPPKITDGIIIFNLSVIHPPIELIVYGFFRKKTFYISSGGSVFLQSKTFHACASGVGHLIFTDKPFAMDNIQFVSILPKPISILPKVKFNSNHIYFKKPIYNQTDFI